MKEGIGREDGNMRLRKHCVALCLGMLAGWTVAVADGVPFEDWKVARSFSNDASGYPGVISGIAVIQTAPPRILVSSCYGYGSLFRSDNGGADWTQIGPGKLSGFAVNPSDPSLLLATKDLGG